MNKIVFLTKTNLNKKLLISKNLNDLYISYDKFVLENSLSKECDDMKEEIKNLKTLLVN